MEYSIQKQAGKKDKRADENQNTSYKMVDLNPTISIITLNVNSQIEAHRETRLKNKFLTF